MTGPEFAALLERLGLTQVALRREIEALTGHAIDKGTTTDWIKERRTVNPYIIAYLRLREQKGPPSI